MKRDVPANGVFDIDGFSELLFLAKNKEESMRDFSKRTGLSEGFLSRYMHKKTKNPPTVSSLMKIVDASSNPYVTLDRLLFVSGYKREDLEKSRKYSDFVEINTTIHSLIVNATEEKGYAVASERSDYQDYIDYPVVHKINCFDYCATNMLHMEDPKFWAFNYICLNTDTSVDLDTQISELYGKLVCIKFPDYGKYSFVTHDPETYRIISKTAPVLLPIYVSVVLVDAEKKKIIKEKYLKTRIPQPSSDFKRKYSLTRGSSNEKH